MSYIGHGLSHAIFGGAATCAALGVNFFVGAGVWGVASALADQPRHPAAHHRRRRRHRRHHDRLLRLRPRPPRPLRPSEAEHRRHRCSAACSACRRPTCGSSSAWPLVAAAVVVLLLPAAAVHHLRPRGRRRRPACRTARIDALLMLVLASSILATMKVLGVTLIAAALVDPAGRRPHAHQLVQPDARGCRRRSARLRASSACTSATTSTSRRARRSSSSTSRCSPWSLPSPAGGTSTAWAGPSTARHPGGAGGDVRRAALGRDGHPDRVVVRGLLGGRYRRGSVGGGGHRVHAFARTVPPPSDPNRADAVALALLAAACGGDDDDDTAGAKAGGSGSTILLEPAPDPGPLPFAKTIGVFDVARVRWAPAPARWPCRPPRRRGRPGLPERARRRARPLRRQRRPAGVRPGADRVVPGRQPRQGGRLGRRPRHRARRHPGLRRRPHAGAPAGRHPRDQPRVRRRKATPRQSVLQAGTAVLVTASACPPHCACGNPLLEPAPIPEPTFEGEPWDGFRPGRGRPGGAGAGPARLVHARRRGDRRDLRAEGRDGRHRDQHDGRRHHDGNRRHVHHRRWPPPPGRPRRRRRPRARAGRRPPRRGPDRAHVHDRRPGLRRRSVPRHRGGADGHHGLLAGPAGTGGRRPRVVVGRLGNLYLEQLPDGLVVGAYGYDEGVLVGRLVDSSFRGTWCEVPTRKGPTDAGPVELTFVLVAGQRTIDGRWRYAAILRAARGGRTGTSPTARRRRPTPCSRPPGPAQRLLGLSPVARPAERVGSRGTVAGEPGGFVVEDGLGAERRRLAESRAGTAPWRRWGPYLVRSPVGDGPRGLLARTATPGAPSRTTTRARPGLPLGRGRPRRDLRRAAACASRSRCGTGGTRSSRSACSG